jgi:hypothetical protein
VCVRALKLLVYLHHHLGGFLSVRRETSFVDSDGRRKSDTFGRQAGPLSANAFAAICAGAQQRVAVVGPTVSGRRALWAPTSVGRTSGGHGRCAFVVVVRRVGPPRPKAVPKSQRAERGRPKAGERAGGRRQTTKAKVGSAESVYGCRQRARAPRGAAAPFTAGRARPRARPQRNIASGPR